ncbi:MAG: MOSC domain-containing protein [Blastocatellia bacterium]|nr:MOSC domain-containing protein [Blastocatellia bacterium]
MSNQFGKLITTFIGSNKGASKHAIASVELIPDHGVSGDHHAGTKPHRQVSLFANETLQEIQAAGIEVTAEELSTNLLTEGIAIDTLTAGTKLKIGAAIIEISEARKPCGSLTKIDKRLPKATYLRCGQFGRVITGGTIHAGDAIEIL